MNLVKGKSTKVLQWLKLQCNGMLRTFLWGPSIWLRSLLCGHEFDELEFGIKFDMGCWY